MSDTQQPVPVAKPKCDHCRALVDPDDIACGHCGSPVARATEAADERGSETPQSESLRQRPDPPPATSNEPQPRPTNTSPAVAQNGPVAGATAKTPGTVNVAGSALLATATLGFSWLVWLPFQLNAYSRLSRLAGTKTVLWYGGYVVSLVVTLVGFFVAASNANTFVYAWAGLVAIFTGTSLMYRLLQQRDAVAHWQGVRDPVPTAGWMTFIWCLVLASGYTLIGLVVAVPLGLAFFWLFFRGHNYVVEAASTQGVEWS